MSRTLIAAMVVAGTTGWAMEAGACTVIIPPPRAGETFEQALVRTELAEQRLLMRQADAVYLGEASHDTRARTSRVTTLASLQGRPPPRQGLIRDRQGCGEVWTGARGKVVVFAAQIGIRDDPWKPWRWGRWVIIGWRPAAEVVEPRLVAGLQNPRRGANRG
jgi:hypothetical protein